VNDAKDKWDEIINILGNINLNNFLRHYWLSKYGVVNQTYLMNELEKKVNTKKAVFDFLDEIKSEAEVYESIFTKSNEMWRSEVVDLIDDLFVISKNIVLPLLLGALQNLPEKDHKRFLELCISFMFRYLAIAERESKELESLFSKMSIEIRNGRLKIFSDIKERLLKIHVDDETFRSIFMNKDIRTVKIAKYILRKIEVSLDPTQEKFSERITLEHILPKNPDSEWKEYIKENGIKKDEIIDKIGNMTLLMGSANKQAQNKFFIEKRNNFYRKMTKLKINEDLANIQTWKEADVMKRQEFFADKAIKIWPI